MYSPEIDFAYEKMQKLVVDSLGLGSEYDVKERVVREDPYGEKTVTEYEVSTKDGESRGKVVFSKGAGLEELIDISGLDLTRISNEDPLIAFIVKALSENAEDTFNTQIKTYNSLMAKAGDYLKKFVNELPGEVSDKQRLEEYASVKISEFAFDEYSPSISEDEAGKKLIGYTQKFMKDLPEKLKETEWLEGYVAKFFEDAVLERYGIKFIPEEYGLGCLTKEDDSELIKSLERRERKQNEMTRLMGGTLTKPKNGRINRDYLSRETDEHGKIIPRKS